MQSFSLICCYHNSNSNSKNKFIHKDPISVYKTASDRTQSKPFHFCDIRHTLNSSNIFIQAMNLSVVKTSRSDEIHPPNHDIHYISNLHDSAAKRFLIYLSVEISEIWITFSVCKFYQTFLPPQNFCL
ncbi:hypothetical protein RF11_14036 [Thelohanellus kitauei]|uniref:Uncharacterized protein n=1 Tax=Thelohanellus kitauei TaxID=669202 RepID=A0A0C2MWH4_THEKT|nr:hypothetical protein RF11_14036 [Thelohanellus kitauei]